MLATKCGRVLPVLLTTALAVGGANAFGAGELSISAGLGHSDNALRAQNLEQSSGLAALGIDVGWSRDQGLVRFSADGNIDYREYFEDGVDGEVLGAIVLDGSIGKPDGAFSWNFRNSLGATREDLLSSLSPGNNQYTNEFSTGPELSLRFGDSWRVNAEAGYTTRIFEKTDTDNARVGGRIAVLRQIAATREVGLGVSIQNQEYDQISGGNTDYDREEVFLTGRWNTARMEFSGELGASNLKPNFPGAEKQSGAVVRLDMSRKLSGFSSISLQASREYGGSDGATGLQLSSSEFGLPAIGYNLAVDEPALVSAFSVGYRWSRPRTEISLSAATSRESYETLSDFSRDVSDIAFRVSRLLTPKSRVGFIVRAATEEIDFVNVDADEYRVGAFWNLRLGRNFSLNVELDHARRESNLTGSEFSAFTGQVGISYAVLSRQSP